MLPDDDRRGLRVPPVVLDLAAEPARCGVVAPDLGQDLHQHLRAVLVEFGDGDPVRRGVAGLDLALALQRHHPVGEQPGAAGSARASAPSGTAAPRAGRPTPRPEPTGRRAAAARTVRSGRCRPARTTSTSCTIDQPVVDRTEHVGLGDPQVVEEHLVEVVRPHHAADRAHLDRRIRHRHQEDRETLLLLARPWRYGRAGSTTAPSWRRTSRSSAR